jgi:hypothetical protein
VTEKPDDTIKGSVQLIEKEVGVRSGFLESLREGDDWSFVIKTHALLEAAVSNLICKTLGRDELAEVFSHVELSGKQAGKMAFVKALDLLDEPDRRFISSLSELRNQLVHNIANVDFDLKQYTSAMLPNELDSFAKKFNSFSEGETVDYQGEKLSPNEVFRRDPKMAIWWSVAVTVAIIYQVRKIEHFKKEAEHLSFINNTLSRLVPEASEQP